jgi:hypothetical protein
MSHNQKFENELHTLYDIDRNFIHKILSIQLVVPLMATDSNKNTILHKMILEKDHIGVDLLMQNLTDKIYDSATIKFILDSQNNQGNTPAHLAILNNDQTLVKSLDSLGANLSIPNQDDLIIRLTESDDSSDSSDTSDSHEKRKEVSEDCDMDNILKNLLVQQPTRQQPSFENQKGVVRKLKIDPNDDFIELVTITATTDDMNQKRSLGSNKRGQRNVSMSDTVNTDEFIKFICEKVDCRKLQMHGGKLTGIDTNKVKGERQFIKNRASPKLNNDTVSMTSDSLGIGNILKQVGGRKKSRSFNKNKSNSANKSSSRNKPSSDVHIEVIDIIKKMGHTEDDARYIKAGIYKMIKDKFPNLSNLQRSLKLKELTTKEEVEKMAKILPKLKEVVSKAREQRKTENLSKEKTTSKKSKKSKESK